MRLKRIYFPGKRYSWYFQPQIKWFEEFMVFSEQHPELDCDGLDNANYVIGDLSKEEQRNYWNQCFQLMMYHTRFMLDNLPYLSEFKTNWNNYRKNKPTVGKPVKDCVEWGKKHEIV